MPPAPGRARRAWCLVVASVVAGLGGAARRPAVSPMPLGVPVVPLVALG
ncbi:hypothetical protein PV396_17010 [Streptomyces sp. ME02-8801-2C]|nr:hypothetical protein [Streptomyces sp. ME02-8801-2C]MDX3453632.1 hypothetical protein [Streptomyces sp. ME02-8801-2C]